MTGLAYEGKAGEFLQSRTGQPSSEACGLEIADARLQKMLMQSTRLQAVTVRSVDHCGLRTVMLHPIQRNWEGRGTCVNTGFSRRRKNHSERRAAGGREGLPFKGGGPQLSGELLDAAVVLVKSLDRLLHYQRAIAELLVTSAGMVRRPEWSTQAHTSHLLSEFVGHLYGSTQQHPATQKKPGRWYPYMHCKSSAVGELPCARPRQC